MAYAARKRSPGREAFSITARIGAIGCASAPMAYSGAGGTETRHRQKVGGFQRQRARPGRTATKPIRVTPLSEGSEASRRNTAGRVAAERAASRAGQRRRRPRRGPGDAQHIAAIPVQIGPGQFAPATVLITLSASTSRSISSGTRFPARAARGNCAESSQGLQLPCGAQQPDVAVAWRPDTAPRRGALGQLRPARGAGLRWKRSVQAWSRSSVSIRIAAVDLIAETRVRISCSEADRSADSHGQRATCSSSCTPALLLADQPGPAGKAPTLNSSMLDLGLDLGMEPW